ncbi:MAG: GGDEF domain-containing protein [Methylohalobius sp.]|nr:GGDEF domain-containing protein [Methylohalobius sp.]
MAKPRSIPAELRQEFDLYLADKRVRGAREVAVLAATLYLLFGFLDIWAIPSALYKVWSVRLIVVGLILVFYSITHYHFFLRRYAALISLFFLVLGLGVEIMVYLAGNGEIAKYAYYTGLILAVMGLHTWSFLPAWQNALTGTWLILLYLVIALATQDMGQTGQWPILLTNSYFLVSANIIGYFGSLARERYLHDSFLLRYELMSHLERVVLEKERADYWSEHDPLTGLPNRSYLMQQLTKRMAAGTESVVLALLFIDLDGFKAINDRLGHAAGDEVLKAIGRRIEGSVREGDLFARIGGDEFIVVLSLRQRDDQVVMRVARSIIASVERPIREPIIELPISASIGIAYSPDHAHHPEGLIQAADRQMYVAKNHGSGCVSIAPSVPEAKN